MRKSPLIILPLILITLGGVYALMQPLLPDTSEFPRVPTADGTIGGYIARILGVTDLANYGGDGTVENTLALSGMTETQLLKNMECGATDVWTGLNNGTPTCGTDTVILGYIGTGTVLTGGVTAYRADGTIKVLALNDPILEGDIIKTDVGAGITITFVDGSLLRIDGDSTVSLDIGTTYDGQSIAYAILENGGLWGRVLTETGGYYIGNDDIIAGVRGTSVAFTQSNPGGTMIWNSGSGAWEIRYSGGMRYPIGQLSVIHSRVGPDNSAATVECTSASGVVLFDMIKGQQITTSHSVTCDMLRDMVKNRYNTLSPKDYYRNNSLFATNTIADLNYMSGRLAAGGLTASQSLIFMSEFEATRPRSSEDKDAICTDGVTTKTYWDSFVGRDQSVFPVCQDSSILAYANYGNTASEYKNLYQSTSSIFGSGNIDGANKPRIVYTGSQIKNLFSGNVTIKIDGTISGSSNPLSQDIISIGTGSSYLRAYVVSSRIKFTTAGTTLSGSISDGPMNIGISKSGYAYTLKVNSSTIGTLNFSTNPEQLHLGKNNLGGSNWNGLTYNIKINN